MSSDYQFDDKFKIRSGLLVLGLSGGRVPHVVNKSGVARGGSRPGLLRRSLCSTPCITGVSLDPIYIPFARDSQLQQVRAIKQYRLLGPDEGYLQPVSVLFLVAIFMDSVEAFGSVLSSKWAFDGMVTEGTYCTVQCTFAATCRLACLGTQPYFDQPYLNRLGMTALLFLRPSLLS